MSARPELRAGNGKEGAGPDPGEPFKVPGHQQFPGRFGLIPQGPYSSPNPGSARSAQSKGEYWRIGEARRGSHRGECQPQLILACTKTLAFQAKGRKELLSAEWRKLSKCGWSLHLNESNSWLDLNCDSGPGLTDVMKPAI